MLRRVHSPPDPRFPREDQAGAIQSEGFDGCAAHWRCAYDEQAVVAPFEVIGPTLGARAKERNGYPRFGVEGFGFVALQWVADVAAQRQVIKIITAALGARHHMVNSEHLTRDPFLRPAILTAPMGAHEVARRGDDWHESSLGLHGRGSFYHQLLMAFEQESQFFTLSEGEG